MQRSTETSQPCEVHNPPTQAATTQVLRSVYIVDLLLAALCLLHPAEFWYRMHMQWSRRGSPLLYIPTLHVCMLGSEAEQDSVKAPSFCGQTFGRAIYSTLEYLLGYRVQQVSTCVFAFKTEVVGGWWSSHTVQSTLQSTTLSRLAAGVVDWRKEKKRKKKEKKERSGCLENMYLGE